MKKLLLIFTIIFSVSLSAQDCSELLISGYVEGYSNNRALEIFNPTTEPIELSNYSVGRFSNGGTDFEGIQLPAGTLASGGVYVIVIDKRDPEGVTFEEPVWNGYVLVDIILDEVTGEPLLDENGNEIVGVQYDAEGGTLYGDDYDANYDLQGLADVFLCPNYNVNNAMYFNGNDAVALISGTEIAVDGSNIIDVIGVIGEDPGDAWVDEDDSWITRDKTLKRNSNVMAGTGAVVAGGTFDFTQWTIYPKNTFNVIGSHACDCVTDGITAISEVSIKVFPSHTSGELTVWSPELMSKIEVYNQAGQLVFVNEAPNTRLYDFSINHLANGVYMINTYFENGQMSFGKVVKQ